MDTSSADPFRNLGGDHPFTEAGTPWSHAIPATGGGFIHWDGRTFNNGATAEEAGGAQHADPGDPPAPPAVPDAAPDAPPAPIPVPGILTPAQTALADAQAVEAAAEAEVIALETAQAAS